MQARWAKSSRRPGYYAVRAATADNTIILWHLSKIAIKKRFRACALEILEIFVLEKKRLARLNTSHDQSQDDQQNEGLLQGHQQWSHFWHPSSLKAWRAYYGFLVTSSKNGQIDWKCSTARFRFSINFEDTRSRIT